MNSLPSILETAFASSCQDSGTLAIPGITMFLQTSPGQAVPSPTSMFLRGTNVLQFTASPRGPLEVNCHSASLPLCHSPLSPRTLTYV